MANKAKATKFAKKQTAASKRRRKGGRGAVKPEARISVTFRNIDPTPALQVYAERKLGHLAKFLKQSADVHLILTVDKYRQRGEVVVKSGRLTLSAQEETKDLYAVIDLLSDKVERQIKRHVEKVTGKKTRSKSTGEVLAAAEASS